MESTEKETTEGLVEKMDEITNELVEKITEGATTEEVDPKFEDSVVDSTPVDEADNGISDPLSKEEMIELSAKSEPISAIKVEAAGLYGKVNKPGDDIPLTDAHIAELNKAAEFPVKPIMLEQIDKDEYDAKIERLLRLFYDRNNYSEFEFGGRLMDMLNTTDRFDPKFVIELKAFAEEIKAYSSTTEDGAIIELIENL